MYENILPALVVVAVIIYVVFSVTYGSKSLCVPSLFVSIPIALLSIYFCAFQPQNPLRPRAESSQRLPRAAWRTAAP
jgi:hypothetical protein